MITTKRLGYGICVLYELATRPNGYHSARDLAEGYRVPEAFVRRILLDLRRAGVVEAQKGRTGGYQLAQNPEEIKLGLVLKTLEPETPSLVYGRPRGGGFKVDEECPVGPFWMTLESKFTDTLAQSTLAEVVALAKPKAKRAPTAKKARKARARRKT